MSIYLQIQDFDNVFQGVQADWLGDEWKALLALPKDALQNLAKECCFSILGIKSQSEKRIGQFISKHHVQERSVICIVDIPWASSDTTQLTLLHEVSHWFLFRGKQKHLSLDEALREKYADDQVLKWLEDYMVFYDSLSDAEKQRFINLRNLFKLAQFSYK